MTTLGALCPRGKFDSLWEYDEFIREITNLIETGRIEKIEPKTRGEWDLLADFFYDPVAQEIYMLHHPEFPSRGEWVKISKAYLEGRS